MTKNRVPIPRPLRLLSVVIALAAGLSACGFSTDRTPKREVGDIELATWNLSWLASEDGAGTNPRTEADYARLRTYAARLDADVIALQEVADEFAARRVFDPTVYDFAIASKRGAQRSGFAYKRDLRVRRHADLAALDVGGLRPGVDIELDLGRGADGTPRRLRLLALHLKSGCFDDSLRKRSNACRKLSRQLPQLEGWIDARAREGVPFAVLGDFNRRMNARDALWREIDDAEPAAADLTLVTEGQRSRCWKGKYPRFIDHIALDLHASAWLVPNSFEQLVYSDSDTAHARALSDHCPISVRLRPKGGPAQPADPASAPAADQHADTASDQGASDDEAAAANANAAQSAEGLRIKGNVSRKRKLYHLPSCPSYAKVRIDPDKGERWFASERDAQAAGFRKAGNCPP
ncbi:endonuclease/exonuclease/phosphatase family protein [Haliangium ochraceum]|uniref:Endonuclease/exonuclease/phosphatase n=1 Tax=Haliangium ochraceum (strain DSM 14365 / JCM 11303 / SMP-2) TaxID=502025 RepID=D0LI27_HALO1|nr:endonuclease/exonuclease/phosphatase family protein [Haliangium ochraceum]ACY14856.1 Endonuclease/exonuclease/phosphatase [Haliangium ochraceum DSM 14365]